MRRVRGHNLHFRDSLDRSRELDLDGALLYDEPFLPRRSCWRVLVGPHLRLLGARIVRHGGVRDLHSRAVELVECDVGARSKKNSGRNPNTFKFLVGATLTDRPSVPRNRKSVAPPLPAR